MLSQYYGMSLDEFIILIGDDEDKLYRFAIDYIYNNNRFVKIPRY